MMVKQEQIISNMNMFLHTSANVLAEWLGKILPRTTDDWWEECVLDKLSYNQREVAIEKGYTELGEFDLAALLRLADKSWYLIRNLMYIPTCERECIRDMMRVRNNWAHCSASLPGKDTIVSDLETLRDFFTQRECGQNIINEVDQMIDLIKVPDSVDTNRIEEDEAISIEHNTDAHSNDILKNSIVYLIGDPSSRGMVTSITDLGDTIKYEVFINGSIKTFYSGQIELFVEEQSDNWMDISEFQTYLAAYQINNPSARDLYSLNSARIDFVPYQFRPALKIIHADEPRILIADSVGVGKTIEAGLIIKELQARNEIENILIICPKPLVTERKWELEMKRFDEEFVPVKGQELHQIIEDTEIDGAWPVRYNRLIIPYSILDSKTYLGEQSKKKKSPGLLDLDPPPHFDLVIVDEAHHIRNGSLEKEKAFEYKCVKYFCDNADAVVMLTATPLQTSNDDLYTLLNLLRPDVVLDKTTFEMMSRPNKYISACARALRQAENDWKESAITALKGVINTQWGENVIAANPSYNSLLRELEKDEISREERINIIAEVENLHSFGSMLNRTRRKDIQDFCVRRSYTLAVDFTDMQRELHDDLLRFEFEALKRLHGKMNSISFMMSTLKRQAASCIFGLAPFIENLINRRFEQLEDDPDFDDSVYLIDKESQDILADLAKKILVKAKNLPEEDSKFELMMEAVNEKQSYENNKILIFSTFRHTLEYIYNKLEQNGLRVAKIDGSVKDTQRQDLRTRFELPKDDPSALDILLFTEVGSEGLDYQFCDMMINYDLPWNPMKIEQRIGRIDRRGQKSEAVTIYNMITNGTIDADIYFRCLWRIGVFESSIGECDEILGEIATQIDKIAFDIELTESERKSKLEQMADNEVRRIQEMNKLEEEEKEFFGFDLSEFMTAQEIHRAENPWIDQRYLQKMIERYLNERLGQGNYIYGEGDVKQLRISATARMELREDLRKMPGGKNALKHNWDNFLKGKIPNHKITFDSEAAEKNRDAYFITPMHPLSKQAASYFSSVEKTYISLVYYSDNMPKGRYLFSVYAWNYTGMNPRFRMVVVCENDDIGEELPEILKVSQNKTESERIKSEEWDELEKKHIVIWKDEKNKAIDEAESLYRFKKESISNNYMNWKRSLEQKIRDTSSDRLQRMYASQIDNATESYEAKIAMLNKKVEQTDIHSTLIANGVLGIV